MIVQHYKSNKVPENIKKLLFKFNLKNGIMRELIVPEINNETFQFDIFCAFTEQNEFIGWIYTGMICSRCDTGIFIRNKFRRQGYGTVLFSYAEAANSNMIIGPHDKKSLSFFKKCGGHHITHMGCRTNEIIYKPGFNRRFFESLNLFEF